MVTPSRWFAGGNRLDDYRAEMLADKRLRSIVDYPISSEVFPGVDVGGGYHTSCGMQTTTTNVRSRLFVEASKER
jgi:hypothetical protein